MFRYMCVLAFFIFLATATKAGNEWTSRYVTVKATAYSPHAGSCAPYDDGKTSTGRDAYLPGVAVDPSLISYGSRIDIPGYNASGNDWGGNGSWILVDDTGAAMRKAGRRGEYHIDVRFKTAQEAREWGVKYIKVRIWTR